MIPLLVPIGLGLLGGYLTKDKISKYAEGGGVSQDKEVSEDRYYDMLGVLPPIYFKTLDGVSVSGGFAVGEVYSHQNIEGKFRGVYQAFYEKNNKYYEVNGMVYFIEKGAAKRAKYKEEFSKGGGISTKKGFYAKGGYLKLSDIKPSVVNDELNEIKSLPIIDIVKKGGIDVSKQKAISSSQDVFDLMKKVYGDSLTTYESMYAIMLNKANKPIYIYQHSKGSIDGTVSDPQLIIATANKTLAKGIILVHNHPSGNLQPSSQDKLITEKIKSAAKLLDVVLLDHIILVKDTFMSFADEGIL